MKTITSSASKIVVDKYRDRSFLSSQGIYLNKPEILFLPSKKLVNTRFLQQKAVQRISALSSNSQAELETVAETHKAYESKIVHVKFQLQKECLFGEQFFLVGDDPMLGSWDPTSAIPMEWSDGHIWTVEFDIPVGKSIQFKFILKESTGDIVWQPGQDRIFQTWEAKNTMTISEDWENAEYQKITEEDRTVNSEMLVADNVTQPEKAMVSNMDNMLGAGDSDMTLAKIPEKPTAIVAENIGCTKEDHVFDTSSRMLCEKKISPPDGESVADKNTGTEEDILGNNGRTAALKNLAAENTGYAKVDHVLDANNNMVGEKQFSPPDEESVAYKNKVTAKVLGNNGGASMIKNPTAENIDQCKEDQVLNASNNMLGEKQISKPEEVYVGNKNTITEEDVLGNNGSAATNKNLASAGVKANPITQEGDAVLVPGLSPSAISAEGEIQEKDQRSIPVDASVRINEAMNYSLPEEKKNIEVVNEEEQQDDNELKQMPHLPKQEQQPDGKPLESNVVKNDIQWGRRTLQTLLANLGLL
ncbi:Phosphoglucan, water dikinase, chloroplastic-like protein [Melia azedarach]|uniref:Phosphoglucan, water dikinase, chloroplastic-like protein n=1 Tax=Melia azedarach TaxID=155640 RepID=A0ACC1WZ83_MELAZ|nr:Phosphoglucan, water dikinase, chloroplastic-like protein [Melia azedarach]